MARVNKAILSALAELIPAKVRDPRAHLADTVTITAVKTTPDLRFTRVHVSIKGADDAVEQAFAAIQAASGYLRRELGQRVRMRHIPELDLVFDTTSDSAARIEEILEEIARERQEREATDEAGEGEVGEGEVGEGEVGATDASSDGHKEADR
jgi:ribosome-binding factor A